MTKREIQGTVQKIANLADRGSRAGSAAWELFNALIDEIAREDAERGQRAPDAMPPRAPRPWGIWCGDGWAVDSSEWPVHHESVGLVAVRLRRMRDIHARDGFGDDPAGFRIARIPDDGGPPDPDDVIPWPTTGTPAPGATNP